MRALNKSLSLIHYVLKRQRHHPGLTLLALLHVVFAVSLVTYAAFFAFAVEQVTLEYALLTACGAIVGAFIGMAASELFVPFFRITGEGGVPLPTLIPVVAQQDAQNLAIAFAGIMVPLEVAVVARALSWRHFRLLRGAEG